MTLLGIEPRSPEPLANTLRNMPMDHIYIERQGEGELSRGLMAVTKVNDKDFNYSVTKHED